MSSGQGVHFCGPYNSTFFTNCCNTAINDSSQKCPACGQYVRPYNDGMSQNERDEVTMVGRTRWSIAKGASFR